MQHLTKNTIIFALLAMSVSLTACSRQGAVDLLADINQAEVCKVNDWQRDVTAEVCKKGQKVVFLPRIFGNEQLPIIFAAENCDLRYSVALTKGGVACIYNQTKPTESRADTGKK